MKDEASYTEETEKQCLGAEVACANAIGTQWKDVGHLDYEGDIGLGLQVRHTTYPTGKLILHSTDNDEHIFFLVTGLFPKYRVAGCIKAMDGKLQKYWKSLEKNRPAFVVPQDDLTPLKHYLSAKNTT